jgi:ATP-dependent RNA helicase RhlE
MNLLESGSTFSDLNVSDSLRLALAARGITQPTPIQAAAIPAAGAGRDVVGIAQTGTGKTLAFAIPISERLQDGEQALVLAPTRELAEQIAETFRSLRMRTVVLVGGASMDRQVKQLRSPYQVVVATPGRLVDHQQRRTLDLSRVRIAVLDEADRMLDLGFAPTVRRILESLRPGQRMMFSATLSPEIGEMTTRYLHQPVRVEVAPSGTAAEKVDQQLIFLEHEQKPEVLEELLAATSGSVLVFARTRHGARKLAKALQRAGHRAAEIHSDRTLAQRKEALEGFKAGRYRILVATDIAARGIDVKDIALVVNYDMPDNPEDYVHRIGRTGRAGADGLAVSLVLPPQARDIRTIEKLIGREIPVSPQSRLAPPARPTPGHRSRPRSGRASFARGGRPSPGPRAKSRA